MMAVRDFCDLHHTFSNTSLATPPRSNSVQQPRPQRKDPRFLSHESKGYKNFRTYTRCDQVFSVLPKTHIPLKEFSRYTRLPSIGGNVPGERPKLLRQLTYTVLQPVYVRGPSELTKFSQTHEAKKNSQKIWKKRLLPNRIRTQEEVLKELTERKRRMQEKFSRSVHGHRIEVSEKLIDTSKKVQVEGVNNAKGAFWIGI
ncbi:hypothetical protein J6590_076551 [Homalodisca vitripennis]|nr:hypothetical protein J6590_076551 [Homalodisca vitripennis]